MLTSFFLNIFNFLQVRKRLLYSILFIVTSISVWCASNLKFGEDISDFLPVGNEYSSVNAFVSEASGNSRILIFFQTSDSIFDANRIAECMDLYANNLVSNDKDGLFANFSAGYDDTKIFEMSGFIQQNIPFFIDDADYIHADSLINQQHAEDAIINDKRIISGPLPSFVKNVVKTDPLGLFVHKLENLKRLKPSDLYSFINGHIYEPDMKRGIIFFDSPAGMSESNINAKIVEALQNNSKTIKADFPEIEVSLFGAPVIAVGNSQQIKRDTILTTILSVLLIAVILWFSIRNIRNLFLMTATLMFGFIVAGAMAWIFLDKISLIALGISAVFTGIAINYPLHFITHFYHCDNMNHNMREVVEPLVVGNITTVAAFFSLMFAGSNALRDLGFIGGILLTASLLFTLIFLPHFVAHNKRDANVQHGFVFDFSFEFLRKKYVVIPIVLVSPVLIYFGCNTEFDSNLQNINYMTDELRAEANHTFGLLNSDSTVSVFVTATGNNMETALQNHESALKVVDSLEACNTIVCYSGVGRFLTSQSCQQKKIDQWNNYMQCRRDSISLLLEKAIEKHGMRSNVFAPFYELLNKKFTPINPELFSPLTDDIFKNFVHVDNDVVAIVSIIKVRKDDTNTVVSAFSGKNGVTVYDEGIVTHSFANMLNDNFNYVLFAAGLIVFVFLTFSFGRIELSLISFVPLTISWFWILGIMSLFDIKFNIVNIILATFIFGQGDDYAVFMTEGLMYEYARGKRVLKSFKNSVAVSSLIMFVGIGSLIFAKHPAMSSLGIVVVIGMFSVVVASFIFPPLLFDWLTKRRNGTLRTSPYTLWGLICSASYFFVFIIGCIILYFRTLFIGDKMEDKKKLHRMMQKIAKMTHYIPGVPFRVENPYNVSLEKPSVLIANHSSSFDVLCMMTLHPYLLFVTNESQQHNPFYGRILRRANFYPVSLGYGVLAQKLKPFIDNGFSVVVFPEGTRSTDGKIHRFHQGAFFIAQSLNLPITPVMIHGACEAYPKGELMIRKGAITIRLHNTVARDNNDMFTENMLETSRNFRHYFMDIYSDFVCSARSIEYCKNIVFRNYIYKGSDIASSVRNSLNDYAKSFDNLKDTHPVLFSKCGYGELPFLYALLNPDTKVCGEDSEEYIEVAQHCVECPNNVSYVAKQT